MAFFLARLNCVIQIINRKLDTFRTALQLGDGTLKGRVMKFAISVCRQLGLAAVMGTMFFSGSVAAQSVVPAQYTSPQPSSFRACTQTEWSLAERSIANYVHNTDQCIWIKDSTRANLESCKVESGTNNITAEAAVTIFDGFTSDRFRVDAAGLLNSTGQLLSAGLTGSTASYREACDRAGATILVLGLACAADPDCGN